MTYGKIRVATCQFAENDSVQHNAERVMALMGEAKRRGADVAVFHEAALTGYPPGMGKPDWSYLDWDALRQQTLRIMELAGRLRLWVIVGSAHPLTGRKKPHNCLYAFSSKGRITDRYDKRFCTGTDLKYYSPGDHFSVFKINGVRCGMLICYDVRFCELYREYVKRDVRLMFHAFHNARLKKTGGGIWRVIMRPTLQAMAAANSMFISAPNSAARHQSWPGVFITPDGRIRGQHHLGREGVIVNTVDLSRRYYDAPARWRHRALRGILHSGRLVHDRRSHDRWSL
ncbi:MAG: carbon-nitrogen hydrolase family protein [Kiritimatiellae bacterium]|nr:carbon-nitrogen hydrolase family protein [Kiritimatiellia bacterium]